MIPHRRLAVALVATLSVLAARPHHSSAAGRPSGRGLAARPDEGLVLSLTIAPASRRAEVVVGVSGDVTTKDFTLSKPDKIVVDIDGR